MNLLIVDDEESIGWALKRLAADEGHSAALASTAEEALELAARGSFDLIMLDVRLPGADGLSAMRRLKVLQPQAPIVVMTAFGNLATAVEAIRNGAFDYITKPFDVELAASVMRRALSPRAAPPAGPVPAPRQAEELIGAGPTMQEVFKRIALVAPTQASVLITGESGTGKELVARAIHRHSGAAGPLLPIHLAALNPALIESELFGHARGAFTGAEQARSGLLELADGGTAFFDEAGDIPLSVQVKLLRALEQQEVTPVGDARPRQTSFRVIAATHRDLRREIKAGRFREDLYFRLAVFEIHLPPLRERREDIALLAGTFLRRLGVSGEPATFDPATMAELERRAWRGNVRELRNAVEHAALLARGGTIYPEHLPVMSAATDGLPDVVQAVREWAHSRLSAQASPENLYQQFLDEVEPALLEVVLERTGNNRVAAAQILGIHRATLRKKLG